MLPGGRVDGGLRCGPGDGGGGVGQFAGFCVSGGCGGGAARRDICRRVGAGGLMPDCDDGSSGGWQAGGEEEPRGRVAEERHDSRLLQQLWLRGGEVSLFGGGL